MDPLIRHISAWDGLQIHVRVWEGDPGLTPILSLPGSVRTAGDFETLTPLFTDGRRAISLDYPGRGDSAWPRDLARCSPKAFMGDVLDVCAALHVHRALVIGASFGGLMAMGLAAASGASGDAERHRPGHRDRGRRSRPRFRRPRPGAAEPVGLHRPAARKLAAFVAADRRRMAQHGGSDLSAWSDGCFHPLWDTRLAGAMAGMGRDLWPLWRALAHPPILLVRSGVSNLLLPQTVARSQAERPGRCVVTVPEVGHAPAPTEPPAPAAIRAFTEAYA